MVLLHDLATGITNAAIPCFGKSVADVIVRTDIAVDARPPIVTFARLALTDRSIGASCKWAADCTIARVSITSDERTVIAIRVHIRGSKQLSPPKPSGQIHLPLYSLHDANWPQEYMGRLQLKLTGEYHQHCQAKYPDGREHRAYHGGQSLGRSAISSICARIISMDV